MTAAQRKPPPCGRGGVCVKAERLAVAAGSRFTVVSGRLWLACGISAIAIGAVLLASNGVTAASSAQTESARTASPPSEKAAGGNGNGSSAERCDSADSEQACRKRPAAEGAVSMGTGERWMEKLGVSELLDKISSYDYHLLHRVPIVEEYTAPLFAHIQKCPQMRSHIQTAGAKAEEIGEMLLAGFNPSLRKGERATEGWMFTDASTAFLIAALYLLTTVTSLFCAKLVCGLRSRRGGGRENDSPRSKGFFSKFFSEPILFIQSAYNMAQVALSLYMVLRVLDEYQLYKLQPICNAFNARDPVVARLLWIFYASKILDFCDTAFIVVRRKWKQLTFLHIYHHVSIFLFYWININVAYDGDIYLTILLNSFVHCVMYFYYLLRTLEVPVPQFMKKGVTLLQLLQFLLMEAQAIFLLLNRATCPFPIPVTAAYATYILSLIILFQLFYFKTYSSRRTLPSSGRMGGRRSEKLKGA